MSINVIKSGGQYYVISCLSLKNRDDISITVNKLLLPLKKCLTQTLTLGFEHYNIMYNGS